MADFTKEQLQAIEHGYGNVLISASAGSGKTYTMISRLVRLVLQQNVSVNQILALTFTEMAAQDMKEKLKKTLLSNAIGGQKDRIYNQLALVPTADISTLHSFCARLIRTYFFEVGLSPDFSILDESSAGAMRLECVNKTFREFYEKNEEWFYTLVEKHVVNRTDKAFKELVLSAYNFCDANQNPTEFMNSFVTVYSTENFFNLLKKYKKELDVQLSELLEDAKKALILLEKTGEKKGVEFTKTLVSDLQILISAPDIYAIKKPIEIFGTRLNFDKNLTEEQQGLKESVKVIRDKLKKLIQRFSKNICQNSDEDMAILNSVKWHAQAFVQVVNRFGEIYSGEKREENVLDFNDLEHFALKILKNEQIRNSLKEKYKYIFVDEYQDINDVQESIITLLENDNLFMVGDVKQSIYGFRGCNPEFFEKKFKIMQQAGQKVLNLKENFRSAKNVINFVNKIFCYSMTEEMFGLDYEKQSQLKFGETYPNGQEGRAVLHLLEKEERESVPEETARVYNVLQEIQKPNVIKDNHTASLIRKIIEEELGKTYYDVKDGVEKQITYSDIAILSRNRNSTYVEGLVKGLVSHGIPVASEVKESIFDSPEIAMMLNALKLIDCFDQDIPLASTLLSPIGLFSNEDLAKIVCEFSYSEQAKSNYKWTFLDAFKFYEQKVSGELNKRIKKFKQYFSSLRFVSHFIGAQGVFNKLIEDFDLEAFLLAEEGGKKKVSSLRRLVYASVEGGKKLTVKEFLDKVESMPDCLKCVFNQDECAVKMMTIHASKGLEFPVVIVCGLERNMNKEDDKKDVLFSRNYGFAFKYYDEQLRVKKENLLRGVIKEEFRKERIKEEERLFYVATTRATFSLHLLYEGNDRVRTERFRGADKFIDYVPNDIPLQTHQPTELSFIELKKEPRKVIIGQTDKQLVLKMQADFAKFYPFEKDTVLPLKIGVTCAVDTFQEGLVHLLFDEPTPDKQRGVVAHKILENYDFCIDMPLSIQVETMLEKGVLTKEELKGVNIDRIESAVSDKVFGELKGYRLYREKLFLASFPSSKILNTDSEEEVVVQGIIDLLAISEQDAIIVDYKYSSLDKESLNKKYSAQLDAYAFAVEKVLKKKVSKKIIVNLFTGQTIQV